MQPSIFGVVKAAIHLLDWWVLSCGRWVVRKNEVEAVIEVENGI